MTNTDQSSNSPTSDDVATELSKVKKLRKARRSMCTKTITNLENLLVSDDKDTNTITSVIKSLQSGMTELIRCDNIIHGYLDDDALIKDMEESESRKIAIDI